MTLLATTGSSGTQRNSSTVALLQVLMPPMLSWIFVTMLKSGRKEGTASPLLDSFLSPMTLL